VNGPLLEVQELTLSYPLRRGPLRRVVARLPAVCALSLQVDAGECLALVGESGSGKSSVGRALLGLSRAGEVDGGRVWFRGRDGQRVDLLALPPRALRRRRSELGIVFQDPFASLNPRMTVGAALEEPLRVHGLARGPALRAAMLELLERVGLGPEVAARYPHEFSGGQRQRIAIARALSTRPRFLVLDEALSALDVSVQAEILNLLGELRSELGLAYLFITHDLSLVRAVAERVLVLDLGRVVEQGPTAEVLAHPGHPLTRELLAAAAGPGHAPAAGAGGATSGPRPSPLDPPSGCPQRLRCPLAEASCAEREPPWIGLGSGHGARCHRAGPQPSP